jgi:hypothetical protein
MDNQLELKLEENTPVKKIMTLGVNSILVCIWGYSMRMVSFFKVLSETDNSALIQEIGSVETGDGGFLTGTAVPDETEITGKPYRIFKRRDDKRDGWYLISRKSGYLRSFHKWDGQPEAFDHCD